MKSERVPLFVSRFSLSSRTSVGIQTRRLLGPHPDWLHFHWRTSTLRQPDARSLLFENAMLGRCSFLQTSTFVKLCERARISCWKDGTLQPLRSRRLVSRYRDRVSSAYLAPLDESDAKRCVSFIDLLRIPFVLHLWDVLDGDLSSGALRQLVTRANRVFCVSQPLMRDVLGIRNDAELLYFSRDAARVSAACTKGPLRVVIHGDVNAYSHGLRDLEDAIGMLKERGITVLVTYAGLAKVLARASQHIQLRANSLGFIENQEALDTALSETHIAFLPGPKLDPRTSLRSRYSIPSRVLDYLAVGLPIVGTVHKDSATNVFLGDLGLGDATSCSNGREVADWLLRLSDPEAWREHSAKSKGAFAMLHSLESPAQRLKKAMDSLASALPAT
jgi:glycosyltransferase involved in cell wall biosynthesis